MKVLIYYVGLRNQRIINCQKTSINVEIIIDERHGFNLKTRF